MRNPSIGFIVCDSNGVPLMLGNYHPRETEVLLYGSRQATVFPNRAEARKAIRRTRKVWQANEPNDSRDLNFHIAGLHSPAKSKD